MTLAFPYQAQLDSINSISTSYLVVRLRKPEGFEFIGGQHVTLQLTDEMGFFHRTYSIASAPTFKTHLEFCIQVQDDARSSASFKSLKIGSSVEMTLAGGDFQIQDSGKPLVFIAGGSGISPLRSMIHDLLRNQAPLPSPSLSHQIHLLYGCREAEAIPFFEEFVQLSQQCETFGKTFHPLFFAESLASSPKFTASAQIHLGRVTAGFEMRPDLLTKHQNFYLCGPTAMLHSVENTLVEHGIKRNSIYYERYG
jgi:ferredoxin-NADP reductase